MKESISSSASREILAGTFTVLQVDYRNCNWLPLFASGFIALIYPFIALPLMILSKVLKRPLKIFTFKN